MAGKRLGKEDDRHLWPQMLRAIREIKPTWVVGENVHGIVSWNGGLVFNEVQTDLEAEGYEVQPVILPACAVNAPHRRDRVWFVAHSINNRHNAGRGAEAETNGIPEISRQTMDTRKPNGAGISSTTPHPLYGRDGQLGEGGQGIGVRTNDTKKQESRVQHTEQFNECDTVSDGITPHPHHTGAGIDLRDNGIGQTENERREGLALDEPGKDGGDAADTDSGIRCERGMHPTRPKASTRYIGTRNARSSERPNWLNFPTQPPVCSRNDGFPGTLADLTFSKWRNESIKALGNAIIPQIALMIFKSINEYEKLQSL